MNLIIEYQNSADRAKGQNAMINTKTLFNSLWSSDTHCGIVKSENKFRGKAQDISHWCQFEIFSSSITDAIPRGQWDNWYGYI